MKQKLSKQPLIVYYIVTFIIVMLISSFIIPAISQPKITEIQYNKFLQMMDNNEIEKVEISRTAILIVPKNADKVKPEYFRTGITTIEDQELIPKLVKSGVEFSSPIQREAAWYDSIVSFVVLLALMWGGLFLLSKYMSKKMGGGVMSFGKNTSKIYAEKTTGKTFDDVAGQEEAKESLKEIVDFLHHPTKYTHIGAKLPKGALLVGPPGTGKTLLAKAVAGEAKVPFFSLSGSEFVEMFVGMGASRVRDLFKQAVTNAPCIVFIDEIDAIGKSRDAQFGGNDEREQTLNQLLAEMDGFDSSKGVVILAATNRPEVLDKALLRPGRFDRRIIVDLPDLNGRIAILKVHSKGVTMDDNIDYDAIARSTAGASGADLENVINEAALRTVRNSRSSVEQNDLENAVEVIVAGEEKKGKLITPEEKRIVAYHEIGHALVTASLQHTNPVHRISIVPRTLGSLGHTMKLPKEEKNLLSKLELLEEITVFAGGRAAEEIEFNSITTGASNDIERATQMARSMITSYGMSDEFGFVNLEKQNSMYIGNSVSSNYSQETATKIDNAIQKIMRESYEKAVSILREKKDILDKLADILLEREAINGDEFADLLKKFASEREAIN